MNLVPKIAFVVFFDLLDPKLFFFAWKIDSCVKNMCEMKRWSFTKINRLCRWHLSGKSMKTGPVAANSTWTLQRKKGRGNHRENHVQARVRLTFFLMQLKDLLIDHHLSFWCSGFYCSHKSSTRVKRIERTSDILQR